MTSIIIVAEIRIYIKNNDCFPFIFCLSRLCALSFFVVQGVCLNKEILVDMILWFILTYLLQNWKR